MPFQSNAFQENAFQIGGAAPAPTPRLRTLMGVGQMWVVGALLRYLLRGLLG